MHFETVTPKLIEILNDLMAEPLFNPFRLVGGTSLSLRLGHRKSDDIDLFTDAPYGSLEFAAYEDFFRQTYPYYDCVDHTGIVGFGRSYYLGDTETDCVKVDLYYHDEMIEPCDVLNNIRIASLGDVAAMKMDVIWRGGRKKDFWDLHELLNTFTLTDLLTLHKVRNEYTHDREKMLLQLTDFSIADEMMDPICLKDKIWELIKLDIVTEVEQFRSTIKQ